MYNLLVSSFQEESHVIESQLNGQKLVDEREQKRRKLEEDVHHSHQLIEVPKNSPKWIEERLSLKKRIIKKWNEEPEQVRNQILRKWNYKPRTFKNQHLKQWYDERAGIKNRILTRWNDECERDERRQLAEEEAAVGIVK